MTNQRQKSYLLKKIPADVWTGFKKKALDEGADNYSIVLIKLIKNYINSSKLVVNMDDVRDYNSLHLK
jgi:hypothetical protein